jgi:hypothetical protein
MNAIPHLALLGLTTTIAARRAAPKTIPVWLPFAGILSVLVWLLIAIVCVLLLGPDPQP